MKNSKIFSITSTLLLVVLCTAMFSFSSRKGGDSFTVHLGSQLLVQQYVARDQTVKSIALKKTSENENLTIQYSHCGKIGTDRTLSLRGLQSGLVKTMKFPNADGTASSSMNIPVKEILTMQKSSRGPVSIIYSSKELSQARTLVTIVPADDVKASLR